MIGYHYQMRARKLVGTTYVSWGADDAADSAGLHAPEPILPGSATVVSAWTHDIVLQTASIDVFAITETSVPMTAPDPAFDIGFVVVDTTAWTPNAIISLPTSPQAGGRVTVKDKTGVCDLRPIVVSGNGKLIHGRASDTLDIPYAARTYLYGGSEWKVV